MRYRKLPVEIWAITFEELAEHESEPTTLPVEGTPGGFWYRGHVIRRDNDRLFLIPTPEGTMGFSPDDMLITGVQGEVYPCKKDIFNKTYESI